jgi:S-formylglutathione hydrolase FrmB
MGAGTESTTAVEFLDWSLLSGPTPLVLEVLAVASGGWLLWRIRRPTPIRVLAICALSAAVATVVVVYLARRVLRLFPDQLQPSVYSWIAAAVLAFAVAVVTISRDRRWLPTIASVTAVVLVTACSANQINRFYEAYPSVRDTVGIDNRHQMQFIDLPPPAPAPASAQHTARPIEKYWHPVTPAAARGQLTNIVIPGPVSGFATRPAEIYLPPAYFVDPRPVLPVLVMVPGQPGGPRDWLTAGRLAPLMDGFASAHRGLAPVVIVADATGSHFANPLCLDSKLGKAATYLGVDLPAWVKTHLNVDSDPIAWAIGGFSYGGTCALQLATNYPHVYPTFLDISGDAEPSLGDLQTTLDAAFGGDAAAFARVDPLDLLHTRTFPGSAGAIVAGSGDNDDKTTARIVLEATRAGGMDTHYTEVPGRHDWRAARYALTHELPWLATRTGLIG